MQTLQRQYRSLRAWLTLLCLYAFSFLVARWVDGRHEPIWMDVLGLILSLIALQRIHAYQKSYARQERAKRKE